MSTPTVSNYQALLALSTSPSMSQVMRKYLVGLLAEHREMRESLRALIRSVDAEDEVNAEEERELWDKRAAIARAILAKVAA